MENTEPNEFDGHKKKLETSKKYKYDELIDIDIDKKTTENQAGVYAAWREGDDKPIYIGKATDLKKRILKRADAHFKGKRSNDQFSTYVFDEFLLNTPDVSEAIQKLHNAERSGRFNSLTQAWIRSNISFSVSRCNNYDDVENELRKTMDPLLNSLAKKI